MNSLERRLNRLEEQSQVSPDRAIIVIQLNETREQAEARHYAEHPEDRHAARKLLIQVVA